MITLEIPNTEKVQVSLENYPYQEKIILESKVGAASGNLHFGQQSVLDRLLNDYSNELEMKADIVKDLNKIALREAFVLVAAYFTRHRASKIGVEITSSKTIYFHSIVGEKQYHFEVYLDEGLEMDSVINIFANGEQVYNNSGSIYELVEDKKLENTHKRTLFYGISPSTPAYI